MAENEQSYEQFYSQNVQQLEGESAYQNQLMLDEKDEIQLYTNHQQPDKHKMQNYQANLNHQIQNEKDSSLMIQQLSLSKFILDEKIQHQTSQDSDTQEVIDFLQTKYAHFNQQLLIKMLYESFFPPLNNKNISTTKKQTLNQAPKIQSFNQTSQSTQQKDFQALKKLNKTVKIFIEHGYGINIARKYAAKGQNIQPNPYNNTIGRIIKQSWKALEIQMFKIKKSFKPLPSQKFNQIKTPLLHAKNWMEKHYLDIFNHIICHVYGLKTQKPSSKNYQDFYNYVMERAKNKKNSVEKGFYKKKIKIQDKDYDQSSSQQFKPLKKQKFSEDRYKHLTKVVKNSLKKQGK